MGVGIEWWRQAHPGIAGHIDNIKLWQASARIRSPGFPPPVILTMPPIRFNKIRLHFDALNKIDGTYDYFFNVHPDGYIGHLLRGNGYDGIHEDILYEYHLAMVSFCADRLFGLRPLILADLMANFSSPSVISDVISATLMFDLSVSGHDPRI